MTDLDLRFKGALNTTHPVDLVFNEGESPVENSVSLNASVDAPQLTATVLALRVAHLSDVVPAPTFHSITSSTSIVSLLSEVPPPTLVSTIAQVNGAFVAITIDPPSLVSIVEYDNAVYRGLSRGAGSTWQYTDKLEVFCDSLSENTSSAVIYVTSRMSDANHIEKHSAVLSQDAISTKRKTSSECSEAVRVSSISASGFKLLDKLNIRESSMWGVGVPTFQSSDIVYDELLRKPRVGKSAKWGETVVCQQTSDTVFGVAQPYRISTVGPWGEAKKPNYGRYVKPTVPPIDGGYKPPLGINVHLLFKDKATTDTHILFGVNRFAPAKIVIPIMRRYIVINNVELRRVDGNYLLPDVSLTMNIDMDSWTWAFSATMPASALSLVEPDAFGDPVMLEAKINGQAYLLLAEGINRERSFGKSSITVNGRGQSAMLANPYSPLLSFNNSQERTAHQLIEDVLQTNGVTLGWAVDWRIEDWLVPAGAWSHQGSYMAACTAIATAAGAFIQPDPVNKVLRVRKRVPVKPWELSGATPDLELPMAAVVKESVKWIQLPVYNSIHISGSSIGGVNGHVRRTGSAGDIEAPMIVDALITSEIAVRQRGIAELANTGPSAVYSLAFPVFPEVGIIDPGTVIRYVDTHNLTGIVSGVSIVTQGSTVRQTIEFQTYG